MVVLKIHVITKSSDNQTILCIIIFFIKSFFEFSKSQPLLLQKVLDNNKLQFGVKINCLSVHKFFFKVRWAINQNLPRKLTHAC